MSWIRTKADVRDENNCGAKMSYAGQRSWRFNRTKKQTGNSGGLGCGCFLLKSRRANFNDADIVRPGKVSHQHSQEFARGAFRIDENDEGFFPRHSFE